MLSFKFVEVYIKNDKINNKVVVKKKIIINCIGIDLLFLKLYDSKFCV